MSWITRLVYLKLCVGFSILDSVSFLLKFIFLLNKRLLIEKPHTVLLPDIWFLSCNKKFEIQWFLLELEFPKTDLVTNFLKLEICECLNINF